MRAAPPRRPARSPSRWWATRTAARPRCSTSSPAPTSTSGNFPGVTVDRKERCHQRAHPETERHRPAGHLLACRRTPARRSSPAQFMHRREARPASSTSSTPPTSSATLYLTMQLMELGIPMVLALNMMDEVRGQRRHRAHQQARGRCWAFPVVPISAAKNEGVDELVDHALHVAQLSTSAPGRIDFCPASAQEHDPLGAVHRCIHAIGAHHRAVRRGRRPSPCVLPPRRWSRATS